MHDKWVRPGHRACSAQPHRVGVGEAGEVGEWERDSGDQVQIKKERGLRF